MHGPKTVALPWGKFECMTSVGRTNSDHLIWGPRCWCLAGGEEFWRSLFPRGRRTARPRDDVAAAARGGRKLRFGVDQGAAMSSVDACSNTRKQDGDVAATSHFLSERRWAGACVAPAATVTSSHVAACGQKQLFAASALAQQHPIAQRERCLLAGSSRCVGCSS
jgi:hypothetical protein